MAQSVASLNWNNLPPSLRQPHLLPRQDQEQLQRLIKARQETLAQAASVQEFGKYQEDPHGYARNVLKVDLTNDQSDILTSVKDNRFTLVKASHSVGKTFLAAVAGSWWYDCWTEHICYITAPTWAQALGLTFKELKTGRRKLQLPGEILDSGVVRDIDEILAASHYVKALNAERGEGFQGEHSAPILVIIEEGPGVPKYIWEATATGLMTIEECRLLAIGNPTDKNTEFGFAAESDKYNVLTISALEHPNITAEMCGEPRPYPKAISLRAIQEGLVDHCTVTDALTEDAFEWHPLIEINKALAGEPADLNQKCFYMPDAVFQGRVLGVFPTQADHQVIPEGWLKHNPIQQPGETDLPELGVDVARFGTDRTTIFVRRGPCVLRGRELRKLDSVEVATAIKDEALEAAKLFKPAASTDQHKRLAKTFRIKIDTTGHLGTGPYDILKNEGYKVVAVNSSSQANDTEQFKNIRSELWWHMRLRAQRKALDLSRLDPKMRRNLERELSTPTYKAPGQKVVEEKEQIKKRLDGASPDLADGANLAFYQPPIKGVVRVAGRILG